MNTAWILTFVVCSSGLFVACTSDLPQPKLVNLGAIEGKIFFAEDATARAWNDTLAFCQSMGMKIASIDTEAQRDFLVSKANASHFHGNHWTAGRDSQAPRQMVWHNTGRDLSTSVLNSFKGDYLPFRSCLGFYAGANVIEYRFWFDDCTVRYYTLCEVPTTN